MPYIGKVEKATGMSFGGSKVEMIDYLNGEVHWKRESDGKTEFVCSVGSCGLRNPKERALLERKVENWRKRYEDFASSRGFRYEVRRREKRERKEAKQRAERQARIRVKDAGPDLLAAVKAMLGNAENAGELARAAIAKAEG